MKNKIKLYLMYLFTSFSLATGVSAINFGGTLSPFARVDIAGFYLRNFAFIDAIVYLLLFLSLAQLVFTKVYPNNRKEAKMIAIAIGLSLTFSMVLVEMNTGFYLGQLAPVALIIFLSTIAILLYNLFLGLFTGANGKALSACLTYLIIYGLLTVPFGSLKTWIDQNAPMLSAILALAAAAALIFLIIELFNMMGFKSSSSDTTAPKPGDKKPEEPNGEKPKDPVKKLNPYVRIVEPIRTANKKYANTDPIVFGFEVNDVNKPFRYVVVANSNGKDHNVTSARSNDNSVGIADLRNGSAGFNFPPGNYRIILYILNDNNRHILDASGRELVDYTDILCIDTNVSQKPNAHPQTKNPGFNPNVPRNFVMITSPISTMKYYEGDILPISFDVGGPDHGIKVPFSARMYIRSTDGLNDSHNYDETHPFEDYKNVFYSIRTTSLPQGMYELGIKTMKNGRELVAEYSKVTFRIEAKPSHMSKHIAQTAGQQHKKSKPHTKESKREKDFESDIIYPTIRIDSKAVSSTVHMPFDKERHIITIENATPERFRIKILRSDNLAFRQINGGLYETDLTTYESLTFNISPSRVDSEFDLFATIIPHSNPKKAVTIPVLKIKYPVAYNRVPANRRLNAGKEQKFLR